MSFTPVATSRTSEVPCVGNLNRAASVVENASVTLAIHIDPAVTATRNLSSNHIASKFHGRIRRATKHNRNFELRPRKRLHVHDGFPRDMCSIKMHIEVPDLLAPSPGPKRQLRAQVLPAHVFYFLNVSILGDVSQSFEEFSHGSATFPFPHERHCHGEA